MTASTGKGCKRAVCTAAIWSRDHSAGQARL